MPIPHINEYKNDDINSIKIKKEDQFFFNTSHVSHAIRCYIIRVLMLSLLIHFPYNVAIGSIESSKNNGTAKQKGLGGLMD